MKRLRKPSFKVSRAPASSITYPPDSLTVTGTKLIIFFNFYCFCIYCFLNFYSCFVPLLLFLFFYTLFTDAIIMITELSQLLSIACRVSSYTLIHTDLSWLFAVCVVQVWIRCRGGYSYRQKSCPRTGGCGGSPVHEMASTQLRPKGMHSSWIYSG